MTNIVGDQSRRGAAKSQRKLWDVKSGQFIIILNGTENCVPKPDVFTYSEYSQVPLLDRSAPFMEDIAVTKEGVTKLLKGLNPSKALGPDELHPSVLKELATDLDPHFCASIPAVN